MSGRHRLGSIGGGKTVTWPKGQREMKCLKVGRGRKKRETGKRTTELMMVKMTNFRIRK